MNCQEFVKLMNMYKVICEKEDKLDEALNNISPDFGGFHQPDVHDMILTLLVKLCNDEEEWISYYIYELNWGKDWKKGMVTDAYDNDIPLGTLEDLYNIINQNNVTLEILNFINTHPNWRTELSAPPYNLTIKDKEPFVLLKYNQLNSDMSLKIVQEARGLILKYVDDKYKVASMRFTKFFNFGQDEASKLDFTQPVEMSQKIDGSLISVFYDIDSGWHISTSGNIDACDSNLQFQKSGLTNYQDLFFSAFGSKDKFNELNKNYTYIFELVSQYNKVIVPYKNTELYLLTIRDNNTLQELSTSVVDELNQKLKFKRPKIVMCHNIVEAQEAVNNLKEYSHEHFEGFVLRDCHDNRIKLKSADYMDLFFIKGDGIFNSKKILKIILDNADDDILAHFPEYKDDFDDIRRALSIWIQAVKHDLDIAVTKYTCDKKTFAEWAKNTRNPNIMFKIYGNNTWDESWLEKQIRNMSLDGLLIAIGIKERN